MANDSINILLLDVPIARSFSRSHDG